MCGIASAHVQAFVEVLYLVAQRSARLKSGRSITSGLYSIGIARSPRFVHRRKEYRSLGDRTHSLLNASSANATASTCKIRQNARLSSLSWKTNLALAYISNKRRIGQIGSTYGAPLCRKPFISLRVMTMIKASSSLSGSRTLKISISLYFRLSGIASASLTDTRKSESSYGPASSSVTSRFDSRIVEGRAEV